MILAQKEINIAICSRNQGDLEYVSAEIKKKYPRVECIAVPTDVSDKSQVFNFAQKIKQHWDHVDILVNNAGLFLKKADVPVSLDPILAVATSFKRI